MKKATKIWLWAALALCLGTTALNLSEGRWLSVAIAAVSIAGLCVLLFTQRGPQPDLGSFFHQWILL